MWAAGSIRWVCSVRYLWDEWVKTLNHFLCRHAVKFPVQHAVTVFIHVLIKRCLCGVWLQRTHSCNVMLDQKETLCIDRTKYWHTIFVLVSKNACQQFRFLFSKNLKKPKSKRKEKKRKVTTKKLKLSSTTGVFPPAVFSPFKLNSGPFSPSVWLMCADMNTVIEGDPKDCTSTLWRRRFIYGVNVIQPQSEPTTRCYKFQLKKCPVAMLALYSQCRKVLQMSKGLSNRQLAVILATFSRII